MKKIYLHIFLLLLACNLAGQQYPLFSNYLTNQYGFNPAVTGRVPSLQVNALYRMQWMGVPDAPRTALASIRGRVARQKVGLGGFFMNDEAGALRRTGGAAMLSYTQQLSLQTSLSIGVSGGYYNLFLREGTRVRDEGDIVVMNAMNGVWLPDFNAGLHFQTGGYYLGVAVPQILEQRVNLGSGDQPVGHLQRHFYFVTGYEVDMGGKVLAEPAVLFKATADSKLQVDGSLKFTFDRLFWLGASYRSDDAMLAFAGVSLGRLVDLTYAYDMTTSGLQRVSMGSHELSVAFRFQRLSDTDGDGIADAMDQCPDLAGTRKNGGCPPDLLVAKGGKALDDLEDPDEDGVFGDLDECPYEAGPKENRGCPLTDQDFDGIPDAEDDCPTLAGATTNRGCPIDDRDRDGIVDQFDQCPDEAGPFITRGCPDNDTDKDGTVDEADQCPNTYGPASNMGCPVVTPRELEVLQVAMRNLYFDSGKTKIWDQSAPHLDNLAELMLERSDWQIKIIGHTDSRGSAKANLIVSRKRAENVKLYLLAQGVPETQVVIDYAGEAKPFGDNLREGGRQLNRRVELEFLFD